MAKSKQHGTLRIIGGQWRGRRFPVIDQADLRPTPDRVRETLFNWVQNEIIGARCLDLFAGTGALGLEALSRGATHVTFIDNSLAAIQQLRETLNTFKAENATVLRYDVRHRLTLPPQPYDLIFMDPPFGFGYLQALCETFQTPGWLTEGAMIYMESEAALQTLPLPAHWEMLKEKVSGQVCYRLVRVGTLTVEHT